MNDNEREKIRNIHFEAIAEGDEGNCRRLWLSVILQHYLDALGKFGKGPIQDRARAWLEGREGINSGMYQVCFYAGIDFEKTRKRIAQLLETGSEQIDFRTLKRDKEGNLTPQNRRRYYKRKDKNETMRRKKQREEAESFLFRKADNDNFPDYSNDNFAGDFSDDFVNQQQGKK